MPKDAEYGSISLEKGSPRKAPKAAPTLVLIVGCVIVPWVIFGALFWVRSFSVRWSSESVANILSCCFALLPLAFVGLAFSLLKSGGDSKPMFLLAFSSILACTMGFILGENNFHANLRPYYDIKQLNSYPSVDPSKFTGAQLMDAGQIQFTPGTKILLQKSAGFKDRDIYCVAPITSGNGTHQTYDFWAIGLNCCSGHAPDFHCGEFQNPKAIRGLRLMDDDKRNMYRLAVKKAQAAFNLKVSQPIFLNWIADPAAEIDAYQDDGLHALITAVVGFFCFQLVVVLGVLVVFAKM